MKKRILSTLLSVTLIAGLIPASALAEDAPLVQGSASHSHCICGGDMTIGNHTSHTSVEWKPFDTSSVLSRNGGNYYLTENTSISELYADIDARLSICLNGYELDTDKLYGVSDTSIFTICDCNGSNNEHTFSVNENGKWVESENGTKKITGGYVTNSDTITVGDVPAGNPSIFMYGITFAGIETSRNFPAVYFNKGNATLYNVTALGNFSGTAIDANCNSFTMYGGSVRENTARAGATSAGISLQGDGNYSFHDVSIMDNRSPNGGATAGLHAMYNQVTLAGNMQITGNTARDNKPANLYLDSTTLTVDDLADTARIGISMRNPGVFTTGGKNKINCFTSDNPEYEIIADGENLKLAKILKLVTIGGITPDGEVVYDGQPQSGYSGTPTASLDGQSVDIETFETNYSGMSDAGETYSSETPPTDAGNYKVTIAVPDGHSDYKGSYEFDLLVKKAAPEIATLPAASDITAGKELGESTLTGGTVNGAGSESVSGTFTWEDSTEKMNTPGTFTRTVVFTPTSTNYQSVQFDVEITVTDNKVPSDEPDTKPDTKPDSDTEGNGTPKTGDNSNPALWSGWMLASVCGTALLLADRKRRTIK